MLMQKGKGVPLTLSCTTGFQLPTIDRNAHRLVLAGLEAFPCLEYCFVRGRVQAQMILCDQCKVQGPRGPLA